MKTLLTFAFCTLLLSHTSFADYWDAKFGALNVTDTYRAIARDPAKLLTLERVKKLRQHQVILVRGIVADSTQEIAVGYYAEQKRVLSSLGISYTWVPIQTFGTVDANGEQVARAIRAATKPVILIGHSQGGLTTLHALLKYPELQKKVAVWIPIQGPMLGTPLNALLRDQIGDPEILYEAMRRLGGTKESVDELEPDARVKYFEKYKTELEGVKKLNVICITSFINDTPNWLDTVFESTRDIQAKAGYPNDGLVTWRSAVLPGTSFISIPEMDHLKPVFGPSLFRQFRTDLTKTLLVMAADRIRI
jgi:pimeloyl-ACP methyl ester carboxylesterase